MKLFERSNIGSMQLKNRIVMSPMGKASDAEGSLTEAGVDYYVERAKGGTGLIITGVFRACDLFEVRTGTALTNTNQVGTLWSLAEQCHAYDTKVCVQLLPGMGRIQRGDPFNPPLSASDNPCHYFPSLICRPYTVEQIHQLVERVGYSAGLALSAGADAIELVIGGGYLVDEFMTPKWNRRTDEYGGSLENRVRFALECIDAIKKATANNIPLIVKYTPCHFTPDGRQIEEGMEIAKMLEDAGVDAIHVDSGSYDNFNMVVPSVYDKRGFNMAMCEKLREVVSLPLMTSGKMSDPDFAEECLQSGNLDFVLNGRELLADPYWARKVKEGRRADIRPCIRCSECFRTRITGPEAQCAINPLCNNEKRYQLEKLPESRKVLVIGGGPGGAYAAVAAADRGCEVDLVEKEGELGGKLIAASAPEFKQDMRGYVDYLRHEVTKRDNIKVCCNTELKAEDVPAGIYDKIIVAIGSEASCPPVPGLAECSPAEDYLLGKKTAGQNIAVIGGGLVGIETAAALKTEDNTVTVLEMLPKMLQGAKDSPNQIVGLMKFLGQKDLNIVLGAKVCNITADKVTYLKNNEKVTIPVDTVVNATGYQSHGFEMRDALEAKCSDVSVIGDASASRKVFNAVHEAHMVVRAME